MNAPTKFTAEYNPDALATIKAMAGTHIDSDIAATLGWELQTLRERSRRHNIEVFGRKPANNLRELDKPSLTSKQAGVIEKRTKPQEPRYEPPSTTDDAALDRVIETLSPALAEAACVIAKAQFPITAESLGLRLGIGTLGARSRAQKLGRRLRNTFSAYRIEGSKGRGGGYRIVKLNGPAS